MLTVLSPLFLVGIPISLLYLFWLYRNNTKYIKQNVGSNFLFKKLSLVKQSKSKLKIPPRFFIDLLVLSLFFIIFANFLLKREVKNIELVLDNSYSTKAMLGDGNSRLDAIKEIAIKEIEKNSNKTFSIYTSSPKFKIIEDKVNSSQASKAVYRIKSRNAKSSFSLSNLNYPIVIGDEKINRSSDFKYYSVYKLPVNNVGIHRVTYNNALNVKLFNFSNEIKAPLRLLLYDDLNSVMFNELIDFKNESILTKTIDLNTGGEFTLKILPSGTDSIIEDNELSFKINQATDNVTILGRRSSRELNLENIDNYNFINQNATQEKSFVIFDGVMPEKFDANSLVNLPSRSLSFVNIKNTFQNVRLSSINNKSLITNYLNISNIKLNKALVFNRSNLAYPIIESEKGPVLIETIINNKKIIVSGFDLFPFIGKKNLFNSILTLNIFSELSQKKERIFGLNLPLTEFDTSKVHNLSIGDLNFKESSFFIANNNLSHSFLKLLFVLLLLDLVYLMFKGLLTFVRGKELI